LTTNHNKAAIHGQSVTALQSTPFSHIYLLAVSFYAAIFGVTRRQPCASASSARLGECNVTGRALFSNRRQCQDLLTNKKSGHLRFKF